MLHRCAQVNANGRLRNIVSIRLLVLDYWCLPLPNSD